MQPIDSLTVLVTAHEATRYLTDEAAHLEHLAADCGSFADRLRSAHSDFRAADFDAAPVPELEPTSTVPAGIFDQFYGEPADPAASWPIAPARPHVWPPDQPGWKPA